MVLFNKDGPIKKVCINGNKRINSTSKIRKIRAVRKNCIENVIRLANSGIKPHSKGLNFSSDTCDFIPSALANTKISKAKESIVKMESASINIYKIKLNTITNIRVNATCDLIIKNSTPING